MKRITKATHKAFTDALEKAAVFIKKSRDPHRIGDECYEVMTRAGKYWFRPMQPYGEPRKVYDITVFGRFEHPESASTLVDCNPHSGKWNWHAGYMTEQEAREYATHIITRILSV